MFSIAIIIDTLRNKDNHYGWSVPIRQGLTPMLFLFITIPMDIYIITAIYQMLFN